MDEFGRLDVMVTNAGVLRDKVLWKMTDDDFDSVMTVHLRGTLAWPTIFAPAEQSVGERLPEQPA